MFDKIKKLFVVEDEEFKRQAAAEAELSGKPVSTPGPTPSAVPSQPEEQLKTSGTPDPKFIDILLKALEKENLAGEDYLEFKQGLQSLSGIAMDEATKYKSALAMSKSRGANSDKLMQSASHYIDVLKKEEAKFLDAAKGQQAKLHQEKVEGVNGLKQSIAEKEKQIESWKKQLELDKASLQKMEESVGQSETKIANTIANFQYAHKVITGQIAADMDNIKLNS